jgi:alkanesulfonate monooxygenase SsuD/methylene tetrahydromethanopterin reductase-like flavin-dependent oxidoreductase (luciferase family)
VIVAGVSRDPAMIDKLRNVYLQRWARSTVEHYEFDNVGFAEIEGYEYYGALANNIAKHGLEKFNGFLADLQVWGSPNEVADKLLDYATRCDAGSLVVPLAFGGMPGREAEANFDLFATEVLPQLQRHDVGGDIGVTYGAVPETLPATG